MGIMEKDGTAAFGVSEVMTVTALSMSLEGFFAYTEETDALYELENGELLAMPRIVLSMASSMLISGTYNRT